MVIKKNKSWVLSLPFGLRDQPAWVFIGTLVSLTGLSYLLGISQSVTIMKVLGPGWLQVWGGFQMVSGILVVCSTLAMNRPLERLSLRFLSLGFLVYMGWVLTAIPPTRAMVTVVTCISLVGLAEIRVAVLKIALRPMPVVLTSRDD